MKRFSFLILIALCIGNTTHAQDPDGAPSDDPHAGMRTGPSEGDPHAGVEGAPHMDRSLATAEPSADVPAGSVRVTVVDESGAPVAGADLNVGSMGQEGQRNRVVQRTNAQGVATFAGLATGNGQAYRVNLPYEGATYSCTPFQLPPNQGYAVRLTRLPLTRESRFLVQGIGLMMIELRESRLHISQQARLMNLGEATYVFPAGGINIALPRGFLAPEAQAVMTDQRMTVTPQGFRLVGSMPPGNVILSWSFDLPIDGEEMAIEQAMPIRTLMYRVLSDAAPGMRLDVAGFPPPEMVESEGRSLLATQVERPPNQPLERIEIRLHNLPGPNPVRWVAVFAAIAALGIAVTFAVRKKKPAQAMTRVRAEASETSVLDEIVRLDAERRAGKIGPKYFTRQRELLTTELALLLQRESERRPDEKTS